MEQILAGKVAIVTGASRGIGLGIARVLAVYGADLVINATSRDRLSGCLEELAHMGCRSTAAAGDIALPETADRLVGTALERFGRLDILVNCAGINQDHTLHKLTDEDWERVLAVNLSGTFYLMRRAAVEMRRQRSGRILNIGSAAWMGNFGQANYAASKAGVVALTKSAALELGPRGITCNVVCPGLIETEMTDGIPTPVRERMLARIPTGRIGSPEDVGELIAFLASDRAGYINGELIHVGGGFRL